MATQPRTPRERSGLVFLPRDPVTKRVLAIDPLERFRRSCRFDGATGCVLWTGGTTRGRGNSAVYGSFWFEGRRWFAHRWAAVHIHGLDVEGLQVGHNCPNTRNGPQTLCVEHVEAVTQRENLDELNGRLAKRRRVEQTNEERKYWLLVERGYEEPPPVAEPNPDDIPFFTPPAWLNGSGPAANTDCPF